MLFFQRGPGLYEQKHNVTHILPFNLLYQKLTVSIRDLDKLYLIWRLDFRLEPIFVDLAASKIVARFKSGAENFLCNRDLDLTWFGGFKLKKICFNFTGCPKNTSKVL